MRHGKYTNLTLAAMLILSLGVIAGTSPAHAKNERCWPNSYVHGFDGRDHRVYPPPFGVDSFYDLDHFWNQLN